MGKLVFLRFYFYFLYLCSLGVTKSFFGWLLNSLDAINSYIHSAASSIFQYRNMSVKSAATTLRQKLDSGDFILAPGVYDGFSARIALQVGFDALYMVPCTWEDS